MQTSLFNKIQSSSFKGCLFHANSIFEGGSKYDFKVVGENNFEFNLLKENFLSFNEAVAFDQNSYLYPSASNLITGLIENGILPQTISFLKAKYRSIKPMESNLAILTLDHLSTGFKIWLCTILLAVAAFIAELCYFWMSRIYSRLRRYT